MTWADFVYGYTNLEKKVSLIIIGCVGSKMDADSDVIMFGLIANLLSIFDI